MPFGVGNEQLRRAGQGRAGFPQVKLNPSWKALGRSCGTSSALGNLRINVPVPEASQMTPSQCHLPWECWEDTLSQDGEARRVC